MKIEDNRCCCEEGGNKENCIICGAPLIYYKQQQLKQCAVCGKMAPANAACEKGHFVCDECHTGGKAEILSFLHQSGEKDPVALYLQVCALKAVHLHGPEHHSIVPCVLLTAFRNNGGALEYEECLNEAWKRGGKVPGGSCGFLGVCGAAVGAGIFASILCESTPLTAEVWDVPQRLTMDCLKCMTEIGGPRCCKRTGRIARKAAASFSGEHLGALLPGSEAACILSLRNKECLHQRCPYYGKAENDG